jgi:glycosyltransferase involved in cell wall biosynthesis
MSVVLEVCGADRAATAAAPQLAIIIPCYNYARFVDRAIQSALGQRSDACEIIVIDDGSTDNSWDVIHQSGAKGYRLVNGGARAACIFGLEHTNAPFVMFLDADDELKPGAVEVILAALDSNVAKLQFPLTRIDAVGNVLSYVHPQLNAFRTRERLAREVLSTGVYSSSPTSGNVFRRDLCAVLYDAAYDKYVDGVILFAAPFYGDVVSMAEPLGLYRVHGGNVSGMGSKPRAEVFERDMTRFVARMGHLRAVIEARGGGRLADPRDVYYFREQKFCAAVASGRRPPLKSLPALLRRLAEKRLPLKRKLALASFFVLAAILPNQRAQALLAYRYNAGARSADGWLRTIFAPAVVKEAHC